MYSRSRQVKLRWNKHVNMSFKKEPVTLKIILIGDSGVGKSSVMNRYVNHRFTNMYRATIGTDFLSKTVTIDKDTVTLQIWDTAGSERFQSLGPLLYREAHCCMLVFDVTSKASFSALDVWRKEFLFQAEPQDPADFPFIVVGNKTDLSDREVSRGKALQWCEEIGAEYFEGSAKEDLDVEKPFLRAALSGLRQYKKHTLENTGHFQITCKQPRETRNTCEC
ncbi:ras-related protein rab7 [Amphiprion ocellaris]|uniref:Ras-related protein Rab-7b n=1 Tax=Amphiprion ocellaris TaxID=80972 RepID=A0A3Q1BQ31_AMPOC|nr:ras-related protein rab7 [Amphiprion ocellaris]